MPIPEYIRPQLEVYQQLDATIAATGDNLAACIVGANYDLYRYGYEELEAHEYKKAGQEIPYEYEKNPALDYKVDTASVAVFAKDLQALMGIVTEGVTYDKTKPFELRFGESFSEVFTDGYVPAPGDMAEVAYDTNKTTKGLVVKKLLGQIIAATAEPTSSATMTPTVTGTYVGTKATTLVLTVMSATENTVTLKVLDSAGLIPAQTVTATKDVTADLGLGLQVSLAWTTTPTAGEIVTIACTPATASSTVFDGIEFTNVPVQLGSEATIDSVKFLQSYSGVISAGNASTTADSLPVDVTDTGVTLAADLGLWVTFANGQSKFCEFQDGAGDLYVEFRVQVIPGSEEDVFEIGSVDEIRNNFGTIAMENELAYGCYMALTGSQGRGIYAIRVRSNDADGFLKAVQKTESNSSTYNFCPITDDVAVMEAVTEFGAKMSQPDVKKWRVTRLGVDFPGEYDLTSVGTDNKPVLAMFQNSFTYEGNTGTLMSITSGNIDLTAMGANGREVSLHYGDKIRVNSLNEIYIVKRVISSQTALLESGPAQDTTAALGITIIKADTAENELEYVTNLAKNFADRRVTVVWADQAKTNDMAGNLVTVPNKFLACEIAGLASAILPQKSMTHTEIVGVNQASRMYTKYTQKQLDDIAKEGVMIITQDAKATPCYVRHQLTTEVDKGSLYYEDSCTRNLDNISYAVTRELHGFIGKANVTVPALRKLEAKIIALLANFMQDTTDDLVGPSLINYSDLVIIQDPVFNDRIIVKVKLYLPLPLNNIKVYEMAYAARVTL